MRNSKINTKSVVRAYDIFMRINAEKFADDEKAAAIYAILHMPTHLLISKYAMLTVIQWLFDRCFDVEEPTLNGISD